MCLVKYKDDIRYDSNHKVVTHNNKWNDAQFRYHLSDIFKNENIINANVICIDEIQFYRRRYYL